MNILRKTLLLTLMTVITSGATAQQHGKKDFEQRLFQARLAEVCLRLDLSEEVKEKFATVYGQYCHDMQAIRPKPMEGQPPQKMRTAEDGKPKRPGTPHMKKPGMTDAQKVKGIKDKMEAQHRAQELRLAYLEKFSAILNDKQLIQFYEVEEDIQKRLHERAKMDDHAGKGKGKK